MQTYRSIACCNTAILSVEYYIVLAILSEMCNTVLKVFAIFLKSIENYLKNIADGRNIKNIAYLQYFIKFTIQYLQYKKVLRSICNNSI